MPRLFVVVILLAVASSISVAEEWGDLSLRIVYDGPPPTPAKPDLVVNAKDRGVADVFVYLSENDSTKLAVHPSYAKSAKDEVRMAVTGDAFVPRAVAFRTTQTFLLENLDLEAHTIKSSWNDIELMLPPGGKLIVPLHQPDGSPSPVNDPRTLTKSWILARDNPYFALSDASGRVLIKNVPAGKRTFRIWHERAGYLRKGTIDGKPVDWPKGRITPLEIKPRMNALGELVVPPAMFGK
jgi:hypothetical protein